MHLVHSIALNLEDPLVLHASKIRGNKTFTCLAPYLLLIHINKFLFNCLSPFCLRICIGMVPGFGEGLGSSGTGLVVTIARSIRKFKFLMALFSCVACLTILLALSLYEAWSFLMACTNFALIVVWGVAFSWSSTSSSKTFSLSFLKSS